MTDKLIDELVTIRDWLRWAVSRFTDAKLYFGHGTDNAWDEAIWLIFSALKVPTERLEPFLDARLTRSERSNLLALLEKRIEERIPTAYLLNEAWLGEFCFFVDPRVIIPRSYFAELLRDGFAPWIEDSQTVTSALDLCTGSGCLAIVMAHAFPNAAIDAIDISVGALVVAQRNIDDYGLNQQVHALQSDLFAAVGNKQYDLIISNPPYVTAAAMAALPVEYRYEPALALAAGDDGLDIVRRILKVARRHLNPGGVIAIEVGHNRDLVDDAFPDLAITWLETENASGTVFLITRDDLPEAG